MKHQSAHMNNFPKSSERSGVAAQACVRVALVEDDEWVRTNLAGEIQKAAGFACVGAYRSAEAALEAIPSLRPDVVLMDINLPGMDGVKCVQRLRELCPEAQFLMLTVYEESEKIFNSLLAGARGYILKRTPVKELLEAIHQVREGGTPLTDHIARKVVHYFNQMGARASTLESLTPREAQVLGLLAQGASYKEVADQLSLSIDTVRMNVRHIYNKLHVHSRGEAVAKYLARH